MKPVGNMELQTSLCQAYQFVKPLYKKLLINALDRQNTMGNSVPSDLGGSQPYTSKTCKLVILISNKAKLKLRKESKKQTIPQILLLCSLKLGNQQCLNANLLQIFQINKIMLLKASMYEQLLFIILSY